MSPRNQIEYLACRAGERYRANKTEIRRSALFVAALCAGVSVIALITGGSLLLAVAAGLSGFITGFILVVMLVITISRRR